MNDEGRFVGVVIVAIFCIMFGSLLVGMALKNKCVEQLKDKPAIEIQAVCK